MKNDKKSVLLYTEWAEPLRSLPLEEKGRIFDAILSYTENGRMPKFENPATDMAFRWIQQKLDENIQKWEETRAKRAAAGKSGGAPKGNSKILEWLTRTAIKAISPKERKLHFEGINKLLGTNFTLEEMTDIYTYLGNGINHDLCVKFVESGYDMTMIQKEG